MTITVANIGGTAANTVGVNQSTLAAVPTTTVLPISFGSIAAGGQAQAVVRFPATVGVAGARVILGVGGAFDAGFFGGNTRVVLP